MGQFWTTGGISWDQDRPQDQLMFDRPNRLADGATGAEKTQPRRPSILPTRDARAVSHSQPLNPFRRRELDVPASSGRLGSDTGPGRCRAGTGRKPLLLPPRDGHVMCRWNASRAKPSRSPRRDMSPIRPARPAGTPVPVETRNLLRRVPAILGAARARPDTSLSVFSAGYSRRRPSTSSRPGPRLMHCAASKMGRTRTLLKCVADRTVRPGWRGVAASGRRRRTVSRCRSRDRP